MGNGPTKPEMGNGPIKSAMANGPVQPLIGNGPVKPGVANQMGRIPPNQMGSAKPHPVSQFAPNQTANPPIQSQKSQEGFEPKLSGPMQPSRVEERIKSYEASVTQPLGRD